jgi:hypothetical protein
VECRADASCIIASPLPPACEWSWNPPRERAPAIRRSVSISEAIHSHSDAVAYHQSNSWGITDVNAGGDSSQAWGDVLSESAATKVDAQSGLSAVMAVKDATELENTRRAANLTAAVLKVKKMPTGLLRGFGWEISRGRFFSTPADFPPHECSPRYGGYTYAAKVWDASVVQGTFSVAPVPNPLMLTTAAGTRGTHRTSSCRRSRE